MLDYLHINASSISSAALLYARSGIPVFPCTDKRPCVSGGFNAASTDLDQINAWWQRFPDANIGSPTGANSFVLDIDPPHGEESLAFLESNNSLLPETLTQRTGSGGRHLFFSKPVGMDIRNSAGKLGLGLDIRGTGGYVILPPSIHKSGNSYQWITEVSPVEAPAWLIELIVQNSKSGLSASNSSTKNIPYVQSLLEAKEGTRNDSLNKVAFQVGKDIASGKTGEASIDDVAEVALKTGLGSQEIQKTIQSGVKAGKRVVEENNPYSSLETAPWPIPAKNVFYGLAGEFAQFAVEQSEADPIGVLATFLCRFGVEIGHSPHMFAGEKQYGRINVVLVGQSSKARKGTSALPIRELFSFNEKQWIPAHTSQGPLSSGEGLIHAIRDPEHKFQVDKSTGVCESITTDPGVEDKRLFILDQEFAGALACTKREGNTLSTIIRTLFDGGTIEPLTKTSRLVATNPHVAITTHITLQELHARLDRVEIFNGFANRFLWLCVRRTKLIPFPEPLNVSMVKQFQDKLISLLKLSKSRSQMDFSPEAKKEWGDIYPFLAKERADLLGSVLNRSEAYVRRIALIYALLDGCESVELSHLRAALSLWDFCEQSAQFIFAGMETDSTCQKILEALEESGGSLDTSGLYKFFGNHISKKKMTVALNNLLASKNIRLDEMKPEGGGRPRKLFYLCE
ncbi:bifunctional DNA primase/polymerase [Maridesulfovibrio sp.]|uniref:bifunctional DNA primase/polymerase n=1 Tax=Maridesulfovibrio sp. TaxID=2795000 RepID=UPI0029F5261F|nr:bifunctional DNA primase/polymerase [Maridesulfovibrio sp.]